MSASSKPLRMALASIVTILLAACGGGGSDGGSIGPIPPPPDETTPLPTSPSGAAVVRLSTPSPFAAGCGGSASGGTLYRNAEVEPSVAIDPANPARRIAVWQQDRWSNGGAQGIVAARSSDGGQTWSAQPLPVSLCANGSYGRASNPWVSIAPDGNAYALSLTFTGNLFTAGSSSGMVVNRSTDGGVTWSAPVSLIADGSAFFNDKGAITADPVDARFVYAVWDRLEANGHGPAELARSSDGGLTWEPARAIYDPGAGNQTISNVVVVLPDGTLVDVFTEIDNGPGGSVAILLRVIRSTDHGTTWSAPITVSNQVVPGVVNPQTGASIRTSEIIPSIAVDSGGGLIVVWQDARFGGGRTDGIVLSRSADGGLTWSAPVAINGAPSAQAFSPTVAVLADGGIGVSYYDFRNDTADASTLLTSYWLARSDDGTRWGEVQLASPFDLDRAPDTRGSANGRFLGDYQALLPLPSSFAVVYAQTNATPATNSTDIYGLSLPRSAGTPASYLPVTTTAAVIAPEQERVIQQNVKALIKETLKNPL